VPYHVQFSVGVAGVLAGLAILDSLVGAAACGLLAQAILDLTGRRSAPDLRQTPVPSDPLHTIAAWIGQS
jgi:hypothetical protein